MIITLLFLHYFDFDEFFKTIDKDYTEENIKYRFVNLKTLTKL